MRISALVIATVGAIAAAIALAIALGYRAQENQKLAAVVARNCVAIERLKSYTHDATARALKTLPTLTYYKQHPDELRIQIRELRRLRMQFAPRRC